MGSVISIELEETWSLAPKRVAVEERTISGAPIRPPVGIHRGTSRDWYMIVAKQRALTAAMIPGPIRKLQFLTAMRELAEVVSAAVSVAPAKSCRSVYTARTARTPAKSMAASSVRLATKPTAR